MSASGTERARRESIRCLVDARLLTPTYDRDTASYLFPHDELARVTRESLPPGATRRAACATGGRVADADGTSQSLIATHFEAAGQSAEAHRHAVLAADAALRLYDSGAASTLLSAAARHAPSPAALASVRVRLAELAEASGHYEDAEALCDLALGWYDGDADPVQAIRLKRMRLLVQMQRGLGARETLDALFALVDEATAVGADVERAAILLIISQMLARIGDQRESQHVAEECLAIAMRCADSVLLADCYNRVAVSTLLSDAPRARTLFLRALDLIVPTGDAMRRSRTLNNIGILDMMEHRWADARESFAEAVEFARTAGLTEHWARAALNAGVLAIRNGDIESASSWLGEALRISAEAQNTELQLGATYNLANVARDNGNYVRARTRTSWQPSSPLSASVNRRSRWGRSPAWGSVTWRSGRSTRRSISTNRCSRCASLPNRSRVASSSRPSESAWRSSVRGTRLPAHAGAGSCRYQRRVRGSAADGRVRTGAPRSSS